MCCANCPKCLCDFWRISPEKVIAQLNLYVRVINTLDGPASWWCRSGSFFKLLLRLSSMCWFRVPLHRSVAAERNGWRHLQWASWSSERPQWRSHLSGFQPWWWTAALWWERQGAHLNQNSTCLPCCRNESKVLQNQIFNFFFLTWSSLISGSDVMGCECVSCCSGQVAPSQPQRLDHWLCLDPGLCGRYLFPLQ